MIVARNLLGAALAIGIVVRLVAWLIEPVLWLVAALFVAVLFLTEVFDLR